MEEQCIYCHAPATHWVQGIMEIDNDTALITNPVCREHEHACAAWDNWPDDDWQNRPDVCLGFIAIYHITDITDRPL